jgi:hypothetical protein
MKRSILAAVAAQAIGGLRWLLLPISNTQDQQRQANSWGWHDPAMDEHWRRVEVARGLHVTFEALKNVTSEWTRFDPAGSPGQRGSKILLGWAALAVIAALLLGAAIGVSLTLL